MELLLKVGELLQMAEELLLRVVELLRKAEEEQLHAGVEELHNLIDLLQYFWNFYLQHCFWIYLGFLIYFC